LGDQRARIVGCIPLERRVAMARGYLAVLGVGVDDLRAGGE
jgi:hypothetical protein